MIRRLGADDGQILRDLRLRALADAPYAFASSLARETALTDQDWESWAGDPDGAVFAALENDDHATAMAGGYLADGMAHLWGMWVEPAARRRGLAKTLVQSVLAWASGHGATRIDLQVTDCPEARPAAALYEALGFTDTGDREPLDSDKTLTTRVLAREL